MRGITQKVLANPGKYSIQELSDAVEHGVIPAFIAIPIIQEKVQDAKQAQSAQAMQRPMNQIPVAQQIMAEARGLESLPTDLPTQYAHGGIVAFEEGGEVERYQSQGLVQPSGSLYDPNRDPLVRAFIANRDQQSGLVGLNPLVGGRLPGESFEDFKRRVLQADAQVQQQRLLQANQASEAERQRLLAERGGPIIPNRPLMGDTPITAIQSTPTKPVAQPTTAEPAPSTSESSGTTTPPSTGTGLGGISALGRTPGQGFQPTGFPEPPKGMSMADFVTRQLYGTETEPGFLSRSETRERKLIEDLGKNRLQGKAFEGLEASLKKEAEDAGVEKADAKNMAIFKAGLAMMAGTSRHALENIGKGALTGAEDYQAAVKDLKKAEKERQRQFAYIEQARRAEDQDELKRRDNLLIKANESAQKRDEFGVNAIVNATGKDRDQATEIWKTQYGGEKSVQVAHITGGYTMGAANARLAALLASSAGRGQMNQKQVGDALLQLQQSPEVIEYRKKLIEKSGKNAVNTQEFKDAMDKFVGGLFQKYYGGTTRGGSVLSGGINIGQEDMDLIQQYLRR